MSRDGLLTRGIGAWIFRRLGARELPKVSSPHALSGYLAVSRMPGASHALDDRIALLASQLAAELSGCRWCIDRGQHDWRRAGQPQDLLSNLWHYPSNPLFSERERAALAFVHLAGRSTFAGMEYDGVLQRARQFLTESELAELTAIVADHHGLGEPFTFNHPGS